jgi:hypothetical protein
MHTLVEENPTPARRAILAASFVHSNHHLRDVSFHELWLQRLKANVRILAVPMNVRDVFGHCLRIITKHTERTKWGGCEQNGGWVKEAQIISLLHSLPCPRQNPACPKSKTKGRNAREEHWAS